MPRLAAYAISTLLVGALLYFFFAPTPAERLAAAAKERRWEDLEAEAQAQLVDAPSAERAELYRVLGVAYSAQDEHAQALDAFRNASSLLPEERELSRRMAIAIVRIGEGHEAQGEIAVALKRYREAVELAPEIRHGHRALVAALRKHGGVEESVAALESALEQVPEDVTLRLQLAWLLASHPDPAKRDAERAIAVANEVLMHDRTPETLDTFAVALAALGQYEDAIRFELDAIELAGGPEGRHFAARRKRLAAFAEGEPYIERASPGDFGD